MLINHCYSCNLGTEWNGKKIKLHIDHINGDSSDNQLKNLQILCPNCHSQTETYCGAKAKKEKHAYKYVCKTCGNSKKNSKSINCAACDSKLKPTKIEWPNPESLLVITKQIGFSAAARQLGVSDAAVRKFLRKNKLL